ncbi:MAG TPA: hypothetical protein VG819_00615 [Rhizomicrobium sp.]|jgi:hypothetical protein|nr:hypothetical protein [Rhizomicrobium sp.]
MRSKRTLSGEGSGWAAWFVAAIAGLIVAAAVGLAIYGGRVSPVTRHYEQAVPDDRLPH